MVIERIRARIADRDTRFTCLATVLLVFFLELLSEFVARVYALNLLSMSLNARAALLLLLLSPALLISLPKYDNRYLAVSGTLLVCSRLLVTEFPGPLIAGFGSACFLLFYAGIFLGRRTGDRSYHLSLAMALSVSVLVLLKTAGATFDITMAGERAVDILLGILALSLLWNLFGTGHASPGGEETQKGRAATEVLGFGQITAICLGQVGMVSLWYFAFSSPAVICRWADACYPAVIAAPALGMLAMVAVRPRRLKPIWLEAANVALVASLTLTAALHAPGFKVWQQISLYLALVLSPVLFLDFTLLAQRLFVADITCRKLGAGLTIAMFYFIGMILAMVFTITYEYVPWIGFLFRDSLWALLLLAGTLSVAPLGFSRRDFAEVPGTASYLVPAVLLIIAAFAAALTPSPLPAPQAKKFTAVTYNIQQGFDPQGNSNHQQLLDALHAIDADIIALQESDTCRISSGNVDIVRFLAEKLRLHSYFGPKTVTGTFGIALLSRYPIESAQTHYMPSKGEQTATIEARVNIGSKTLSVFITHFGEYEIDHIRQSETVAELICNKPNVVLLGDFNITPGSPHYHYLTHYVEDAWVAAGNSGTGHTWGSPDARIDYILVSRDLIVQNCEVRSDIRASDHVPVVAVIE